MSRPGSRARQPVWRASCPPIFYGTVSSHHALSPDVAALDAEHGRGVALVHALVDQVRFESRPEHGTVVHFVESLHFDDNLPVRKLMREPLDRNRD